MTTNSNSTSSVKIHPTAIVDYKSQIAEGCEIGPYCVVGPKVKLGKGTILHSHVIVDGNTEIGSENNLFSFSAVGTAPQDLKFRGEDSRLIIGDKNIIREYVTIQPGTENGGMITQIGSGNLFMANSHVGHDVIIGNNCWFANSVALAGHVIVEDNVIVGGLSGIHQFVKLGINAMIGAGSMVAKDVPPFCYAQGDRAGLVGINKIGMQRRGFTENDVVEVEKVYRKVFLGAGLFSEKISKLMAEENNVAVKILLDFISKSQRGVCFPRKRATQNSDGE